MLRSITKAVCWGAGEAAWGGRVPQQVCPLLSQPHLLYLMDKPPSPSKFLTPKPACLFRHVQIASLNLRKKKTQAMIQVIQREPLAKPA